MSGFSMSVVDEEVLKEEVSKEMDLVPAEKQKLHNQASGNIDAIFNCDYEKADKKLSMLNNIESFGLDTMTKSSQKNSLLSSNVGKLAGSGAEGSLVSNSLMDLSREVKSLDPSGLDFAKKGFLGKISNPIKNYFAKYEKSESVIADIVKSLDKGKEILKNDNITLAREEQALRELTKRLQQEIELGTVMDEQIVEKIEQVKNTIDSETGEVVGTPEKVKFIEEEILFPLRQRIMDMQTMIVVNHQGIVSMEIIQRNNKELMRGVDRAKTVTVTALRNAVMVASALYNQKIVLKKLEAINQTTGNMIAATSRMLNEQGAEIHKQASNSTISVEILEQSFNDVMSALEQVSTFKQEALPQMKRTIGAFKELADKGEVEIQRLEKGSKINLSITE